MDIWHATIVVSCEITFRSWLSGPRSFLSKCHPDNHGSPTASRARISLAGDEAREVAAFYRTGDGSKPGPLTLVPGGTWTKALGKGRLSVSHLPPQVPIAFYLRWGDASRGWGPISAASAVVESSKGEAPARPTGLSIAPLEGERLDCRSLKLIWDPNRCAI